MRMQEVSISYRFRTKGKSFISVKYLWITHLNREGKGASGSRGYCCP